MTTIKLKKNDRFTILDDAGRLFFREEHNVPTAPFIVNLNSQQITPNVEYWEMTADEDIKVDGSVYVTSGNGLIFDSLVGQRPRNSRRSR
jgi:hypothetical protein